MISWQFALSCSNFNTPFSVAVPLCVKSCGKVRSLLRLVQDGACEEVGRPRAGSCGQGKCGRAMVGRVVHWSRPTGSR